MRSKISVFIIILFIYKILSFIIIYFHFYLQKTTGSHVEELKKIYSKSSGRNDRKLVKNMTDSDLLNMHYLLTGDEDLDDDELEEGFYIAFLTPVCLPCPSLYGLFYQESDEGQTFLLYKSKVPQAHLPEGLY